MPDVFDIFGGGRGPSTSELESQVRSLQIACQRYRQRVDEMTAMVRARDKSIVRLTQALTRCDELRNAAVDVLAAAERAVTLAKGSGS